MYCGQRGRQWEQGDCLGAPWGWCCCHPVLGVPGEGVLGRGLRTALGGQGARVCLGVRGGRWRARFRDRGMAAWPWGDPGSVEAPLQGCKFWD